MGRAGRGANYGVTASGDQIRVGFVVKERGTHAVFG